ncbi:MAG: PAS domain-containing protein [Spirochaetia bacterium]
MDILEHMRTEDRRILQSAVTLAEGISRQFGTFCEVLVHSLEDPENSIIAIYNGHVTGREEGGPMTDFALSLLDKRELKEEVFGPYYSSTSEGKRLKSTTTVLKNEFGEVIGFLCINMDISASADEFLREMMPDTGGVQTVTEHYPLTAKDLVDNAFKSALDGVHGRTGISSTQKNKIVVEDLYRRGIFHVKNGVDLVADLLGVSRYTIYNYIREVKQSIGSTETEGP